MFFKLKKDYFYGTVGSKYDNLLYGLGTDGDFSLYSESPDFTKSAMYYNQNQGDSMYDEYSAPSPPPTMPAVAGYYNVGMNSYYPRTTTYQMSSFYNGFAASNGVPASAYPVYPEDSNGNGHVPNFK